MGHGQNVASAFPPAGIGGLLPFPRHVGLCSRDTWRHSTTRALPGSPAVVQLQHTRDAFWGHVLAQPAVQGVMPAIPSPSSITMPRDWSSFDASAAKGVKKKKLKITVKTGWRGSAKGRDTAPFPSLVIGTTWKAGRPLLSLWHTTQLSRPGPLEDSAVLAVLDPTVQLQGCWIINPCFDLNTSLFSWKGKLHCCSVVDMRISTIYVARGSRLYLTRRHVVVVLYTADAWSFN
jgi:hypothetical protein